jgi:hypothetical protein
MPDTLPLKPIETDTADKIAAAVGERDDIAKAIAPVVGARVGPGLSAAERRAQL